MTPNDIEVLIHCHVSPAPHPRIDAPAVKQAINKFVTEDCLVQTGDNPLTFGTTARGVALVKMLCDTPLPEKIWKDPRF